MIAVRKYIIDTNCYIDAARDAAFAESLAEFAMRVAPGLHVSSVVLAELEAGLRGGRERKVFQREFVQLFASFRRIVVPGETAWRDLGSLLGELRGAGGGEGEFVRRSFAFDVLLAASCREIGATLVTRNARDFRVIARHIAIDYIAPLE